LDSFSFCAANRGVYAFSDGVDALLLGLLLGPALVCRLLNQLFGTLSELELELALIPLFSVGLPTLAVATLRLGRL
jgi:hypothetical protein